VLSEAQISNLVADLAGKQSLLGYTAESVANKGAANGYASLDSSAHVPSAQSAPITGDVTKAAGASMSTVVALNGTSLAGLASGMLKNTTGTGVPTIATAGTDYQAPLGYTPENTTNKGAASGYAPLNASSQVPLANMPVTGAGTTLPTLAATPTVGNCLNWSAGGVHDSGVACGGGLVDPGSNGMLKRTALNATAAALAGTDYYAPGSAIASSDLPFPGASAKGGVLTTPCSAGYAVDYYQTNGTPHCVSLSASAFDPIDPTTAFQKEHFTTGLGTAGNVGQNGLNQTTIGSAPTFTYVAGTGHPGVLRLTTTATSGQGGTVGFNNGVSGGAIDGTIWSTKNWDYYWIGALGSNSTGVTSNIFYAGISNVSSSVNASAAWRVRYDTSLSTPDANFMFQLCNATGANGCATITTGTDTASQLLDSGITPVAGTWYQLHIWHRMVGVGGAETVYMSINGAVAAPGYKTFCASGCDAAISHEPTSSGGTSAEFLYVTNTTAARSVDVDYMAYSITGLQLY
jgi:hypothetical protein